MHPRDVRSEFLKRRRTLLEEAFKAGDVEEAAAIIKETMRLLGDADAAIVQQRAKQMKSKLDGTES